jgi:hypothetical protein
MRSVYNEYSKYRAEFSSMSTKKISKKNFDDVSLGVLGFQESGCPILAASHDLRILFPFVERRW